MRLTVYVRLLQLSSYKCARKQVIPDNYGGVCVYAILYVIQTPRRHTKMYTTHVHSQLQLTSKVLPNECGRRPNLDLHAHTDKFWTQANPNSVPQQLAANVNPSHANYSGAPKTRGDGGTKKTVLQSSLLGSFK
jgi:hypothetical protein